MQVKFLSVLGGIWAAGAKSEANSKAWEWWANLHLVSFLITPIKREYDADFEFLTAHVIA